MAVQKSITPLNRSLPRTKILGVNIRPSFSIIFLALFLLTVILLLPELVNFLVHSIRAVSYPYQLDYDEGFNLSAAWQWAKGTNIYAPNTPAHFITAGYPPLYYILNAALLKSFGLSLMGGRIVSLLGSIGIALLIGLHCYRLIQQLWPKQPGALLLSGLVALSWFGLAPVYVWSTLYKQDMLALVLALGGLYFVDRQKQNGKFMLVPAAILLLLAVATKQNMLLAVGAAVCFTLLVHWQRGLFFALAMLILIAGSWWLLDNYSGGGAYNHVIAIQADVPWSIKDMWRLLVPILRDYWLLVFLAGVGLTSILWQNWQLWKTQHRLMGVPIALVLLASSGGELYTLGAFQSNYNHSLAFFPPLLIVAGAGSYFILKLIWQYQIVWLRFAAFAIFALFLVLQFGFEVQPQVYFLSGNINAFDAAAKLRADKAIKSSPGNILSDDVYLQLNNGRDLPYDSLFHSEIQANSGKWDDSQLVSDLFNRRFSLILLGHDSNRLSKAGAAALASSYRLANLDDLDIYVPRERPLQPLTAISTCQFATQSGDPQLQLVGYSFGLQSLQKVRKSGALTLTTYWRVPKTPDQSYQLFVHLIDDKNVVVAQRDAIPGDGNKLIPTNTWGAGDLIMVDQNLPIPPKLPTSQFQLAIGAYSVSKDGKSFDGLQPDVDCVYANQFGQVVLPDKLNF